MEKIIIIEKETKTIIIIINKLKNPILKTNKSNSITIINNYNK